MNTVIPWTAAVDHDNSPEENEVVATERIQPINLVITAGYHAKRLLKVSKN